MSGADPAQIRQATMLLQQGEHERARQLLLKVTQKSPKDAEAARLLAIALSNLGMLEQGAYFAGRAAELRPKDPGLRLLHGNSLFNLGKADAAMAAYRKALELDPGFSAARGGVCEILFQHSRFAEVIAECREGLRYVPDAGELRATLAGALISTGQGDEAYQLMRETAATRPLDPVAASAIAQITTYLPGLAVENVVGAHRRFGEVLEKIVPLPPRPAVRDPRAERRIRVGFLSGDLRTHSVAFFLEPLLERLKAEHAGEIEIACYYTTLTEDVVTARLRGLADVWRNIAQLPIEAMAEAIRKDNVDVLIEMSGHTDSGRLAVLHYRPAPVQMTYLGYPATSGMRAVDYRVVDSYTDPSGSEGHCVESLVRIEPCFLCYRAPGEAPGPRMPELGQGAVFGSFNVLQKINDPLLNLWKRVIDAVPGSKLLLKNHGLMQAEIRSLVAARLERVGLRPEQFELVQKQPSMREHLDMYSRVDVALDTFPYHGTTTTCDALYMGVPVVTMAGSMHASRVGVSLLSNLGLTELLAKDEDGYVKIAAELALDVGRRRELRSGLRGRMMASPICDEAGYAARFAGMLRGVWTRACAGEFGSVG